MAKIMLVEDDKSLQEIYSIRLVAEGYDIARADDGEEALAKAVQEKPDLIIADVMMPKISGFDMLDILRSQPETQNIKVIMMTALSSDDQRQRGETLGAERYLVKSQVGIEDVINAVHEVLGDAPNANAKANMQTASNISTATPAPAAPAQATSIPDPNAAAASLAAVPTTPTTTIQPTNPAAGPAPIPQQVQQPTPQDPNGGISANFNQAPIAMPGAIPAMQSIANQAIGAAPAPVAQATAQMANPIVGAAQAPATQMAQTTTPVQATVPQVPQQTMSPANFTVAAPPIPQLAPNAPVPTVPLPMPPIPPQLLQQYMQQGSALQTPDRVLPNAQLSAAIQAAEATARMRNEQKQESAEQKTAGGERIIQPIHDPNMDAMREQMQKRMADILGDDADANPAMITTKTAKKVAIDPMKVPTAEQAASKVPEAGLPPETQQSPVEQAKKVNLSPDTSKQQDLVKAQLKAQPVENDSEITDSPQVTAEAGAAPQEQKDEAKVQNGPEETKQEVPANNDGELSTTKTDGSPEEVVVAIQPGYITQLEDELAEDSQDDANKSMAERMANELKDDEITLAAKQKAETTPNTPIEEKIIVPGEQKLAQSMANSPNFQSAISSEEIEDQNAVASTSQLTPLQPGV
jgi:CheY-like chemotaxis protein